MRCRRTALGTVSVAHIVLATHTNVFNTYSRYNCIGNTVNATGVGRDAAKKVIATLASGLMLVGVTQVSV